MLKTFSTFALLTSIAFAAQGCANEVDDAQQQNDEQGEATEEKKVETKVETDTTTPTKRDASSGLATGRRQHLPLTLTME